MQVGQASSLSDSDDACALELQSISKRYPGVVALNNVDFNVRTGEVHALVGENGAGKSTLIKMITGAEQPDSGSMEIFGRRSDTYDARSRRVEGVGAIYQELTTVPEMTVAENVFLHNPPHKYYLINRRAMRKAYDGLAGHLGLSVDPDAKANDLSIADRQLIEIMRALTTNCRILIMDEPTAALGSAEREKLYEVIAELRRSGVAIVYISHDLDEVLEVSTRISVMRNGSLVASGPRSDWDKESMVLGMIGATEVTPLPRAFTSRGKDVLTVENLTSPGRVHNLDFTLREGEILGIAGLVGAGRTEMLMALAGSDNDSTGNVTINGAKLILPYTLRTAVSNGIVLVPEDRKKQGFIPLLSGSLNVALTDLNRVSSAGVLRAATCRNLAETTTEPLGFSPQRLDQPVLNLSGGNQQKLVVGKWLHRRPRVLLLDEPTRGVDIGAKAELYAAIRRLADQGIAVILVSSELEEVVEQSDRILVLAKGRIVATLDQKTASIERILSLIFAVEGTA